MNLGKVGVIFSGGGCAGAFSVGFAKAIWKKGIEPECIQGVSVGALSASKIVESNVTELERVWLELERAGVKTIFNWMDIGPNIVKKRSGLFYNTGIHKIIDSIDMRKVVESPKELQVITRNETKGFEQTVSYNHGEKFKQNPQLFGQIVLASAALQGGLPFVEIENERHSDGLQYSLESMIASGCDTIFLLLNDQADEDQLRWDQRISIPRHILSDENTELRLDKFLREHKDFDVIFENDSEDDRLPILVKKMREVVKGARSVMSSAIQGDDLNLVPHRIFVLHTRTPITTLSTLNFKNGDIKAAIEIGNSQATVFLERILK